MVLQSWEIIKVYTLADNVMSTRIAMGLFNDGLNYDSLLVINCDIFLNYDGFPEKPSN